MISVNSFSTESTDMLPSYFVMMLKMVDRPNPVQPYFVVKNGSNILVRFSSEIPLPVS